MTVILVNASLELAQLKEAIAAVAESPNCAEVLSKYRSKDVQDHVSELRVRWNLAEKSMFPKETRLTDENLEAVLRMMASGGGKDVLDVKIVQKPVEGGQKGS